MIYGNYFAFALGSCDSVDESLEVGFSDAFLDLEPKMRSKFSPYFLEKPAETCLWAKSDENERTKLLDNIW